MKYIPDFLRGNLKNINRSIGPLDKILLWPICFCFKVFYHESPGKNSPPFYCMQRRLSDVVLEWGSQTVCVQAAVSNFFPLHSFISCSCNFARERKGCLERHIIYLKRLNMMKTILFLKNSFIWYISKTLRYHRVFYSTLQNRDCIIYRICTGSRYQR